MSDVTLRAGHLTGGTSSWAEARPALAGADALWQDLDGLHVEPLPEQAPPTSILWAWSAAGDVLHRLRLDGDVVHRAQLAVNGEKGDDVQVEVQSLQPWAERDGRVAQYRGPTALQDGLGSRWTAVVVPDTGQGGLTFQLPARIAGLWADG